MDSVHFAQLLQQRLRQPDNFDLPDSLRPALHAVVEAIDELPLPEEAKGSLRSGVLNAAEYINQACIHFVPPVAPPKPREPDVVAEVKTPVAEPEPTPAVESDSPPIAHESPTNPPDGQ
jgi:hypothetical protein